MIDLFGGEEVYNEEYVVEDCHVNRNSPMCTPCKKCGKLTFSKYDARIMHAGEYRSRDHYQRNKARENGRKIRSA